MTAYQQFKRDLIEWGLEWFGLYYGSYAATVVDNDDPDNRGRIKVACPEIYGSNEYDKWVFPRGIFSGKKIGMHFMPQKGDKVWLTFRGGKPEYPLWEYGWWLDGGSIEGAAKDVYIIATPKGHTWVIDEANSKIYFSYKDGKAVEITNGKVNLGKLGANMQPGVLGNNNEQALKNLAEKIDAIYTALSTSATGSMDGGAAYKGAIVAALQAAQFPISTAFAQTAQQTKSQVVNLE